MSCFLISYRPLIQFSQIIFHTHEFSDQLVTKLMSMEILHEPPNETMWGISHGLMQWVMKYLIPNRTQFVKLSSTYHSEIIPSNTGPRMELLWHHCFVLYTRLIADPWRRCVLLLRSPMTAMSRLIHGDDGRAYIHQLKSFIDYCDSNFLLLNISKTKEFVIIDFRCNVNSTPSVIIKGEEDRVPTYRYLGVGLNNKLILGITWM